MACWVALLSVFWLVPVCGALCPAGCYCSPATADCAGTDLKHVPFMLDPAIVSLDLSANKISQLQEDELSMYSDLEYLDLSGNSLSSVEPGAFQRLPRLKVLRLSANTLSSLPVEVFSSLEELQVLDLSSNSLQKLPASIFGSLRQLEKLNLSHNAIDNISFGAFTGLSNLESLDLSHNKIAAVPSQALRYLDSLETLELSYNLLQTLEVRSFEHLKSLHTLSLHSNSISFIDNDALASLFDLRTLRLDTNNLSEIPTLNFRYLPELRSLNISGGFFTELGTSCFEGLAKLQSLYISNCPLLHHVSVNAFSGLEDLTILHLSHNPRLQGIHENAFEVNRTPIVVLDLSHNNLSHLSERLLHWRQLSVLHLHGNAWRCDCALRKLHAHTHYLATEEVLCATPEHRAGVSFRSLQDFDCSLEQAHIRSILFTMLSVVAILACFTVTMAVLFVFRRRIFRVCFSNLEENKSNQPLYASSSHVYTEPSSDYVQQQQCYYFTSDCPNLKDNRSFVSSSGSSGYCSYATTMHNNSQQTIRQYNNPMDNCCQCTLRPCTLDTTYEVPTHVHVPVTQL